MVHILPSPPLFPLDTSSSQASSFGSKFDPLPSPYLFGEPLERVRTRTPSNTSESSTPPSDLLASPLSPPTSSYALGCPLSRVRTRTGSIESRAAPAPLYVDRFIKFWRTWKTAGRG
ncbi:hypothetical protein JCM11251_004439 [Rhodosporidiobolus azoricus]